MTLRIAGMGWVTPLGRGIQHVWERLLQGGEATEQQLSRAKHEATYPVFLVQQSDLKSLPPHPRLRRASAISRYAAAAGLDALENTKSMVGSLDMNRFALIFAASNGGVAYTTRFYRDVVQSGAQSASPLLFPETVFNAPASHLAAILGITGASYTIVGDGAVGAIALKMAENLLTDSLLDYCLVVGSEEADWILCDAHRRWRLLKSRAPIEPYCDPPKGTILSEGAGAVVVGREGKIVLDRIDDGGNFWRRGEAEKVIEQVLSHLKEPSIDVVVASGGGTFVDLAERNAIQRLLPGSDVYSCKRALGESAGASAMWQVVIAAQAISTGKLPPLLRADKMKGWSKTGDGPAKAIVLSCGLNHQVAGLRLSN